MLSRALAEMDNMPIKRVLTHGEKAAAYMADGYARASGRPGICAAQAVGAANLAAGLRDAYMGHSPVIALTGGRWGHQKHKINYQEMDDFPMLTEAFSIPIATSLNGFSLVPDNHPLYIGVPGTYSRSCTNKILSRADLVLYIGSQTAGQVTHF